jgi:hypothetical protein
MFRKCRRLFDLVAILGALAILPELWKTISPVAESGFSWITEHPAFIAPVSAYLSAVLVKTYLISFSIPLLDPSQRQSIFSLRGMPGEPCAGRNLNRVLLCLYSFSAPCPAHSHADSRRAEILAALPLAAGRQDDETRDAE